MARRKRQLRKGFLGVDIENGDSLVLFQDGCPDGIIEVTDIRIPDDKLCVLVFTKGGMDTEKYCGEMEWVVFSGDAISSARLRGCKDGGVSSWSIEPATQEVLERCIKLIEEKEDCSFGGMGNARLCYFKRLAEKEKADKTHTRRKKQKRRVKKASKK